MRAELLLRADDRQAAVRAFEEAVALCRNEPEREYLDYQDRPGRRGRKPVPLETMLRMYLLQVWFSLSDEGVEEVIYDSYAMRRFMGLDFATTQVPDATTLLHFRHLLERHDLGA